MLAYAVVQELATHKFYTLASKATRSPFLRRLFKLIGGDEMRHHVFFREALGELHGASEQREWYSDQVFQAVKSFHMPHLIYDVQTDFFERGGWSIGALGKIAFKAQLARAFSFDMGLVRRLVGAAAGDELDRDGNRAATPRVA
jgi:hypothetical protein